MKKTKLFGWAFVAYMMGANFSACSNDAEEVLSKGNEIKLTSEITASRASNQNLQSTLIVPGRSVGVTITGANANHKNVSWAAEQNGKLKTTQPVYWSSSNVDITAYHPYNADWDELTTYTFSVQTDQSSDDGYLNSDLLWVNKTASKTENPVSLTFNHILSKINITLESAVISDLSGATITICGTKTSALFDVETSDLSGETDEAEIIAGVTASGSYTASAIIIPQTVPGETQFIKVAHNGKTYYYTLPVDGKYFSHGKSYSYLLKVTPDKLEEVSSNIINWDEQGTVEGEMNESGSSNNVGTDKVIIANRELSVALLGELGSNKVKINDNGYAEMTQDDVLAVTYLDFGFETTKYKISSLSGIENFVNLEILYCCESGLTECDLKQNKALKTIVLTNSLLTKLDVSSLTELEYVGCPYSDTLIELDMSGCNKLGHLECMYTQLESIEFSNPDAVWQLICGGNENLEVDLNLYPNLTVLGLRQMGLTTINIPEDIRPNLTWLSIENNQIDSFDLSDYPKLEVFDCGNNNLTSLDLTPVPELWYLHCGLNKISNLDITSLSKLEKLYSGDQKNEIELTLKLTTEQKEIWDSTWSLENNANVKTDVITQ